MDVTGCIQSSTRLHATSIQEPINRLAIAYPSNADEARPVTLTKLPFEGTEDVVLTRRSLTQKGMGRWGCCVTPRVLSKTVGQCLIELNASN